MTISDAIATLATRRIGLIVPSSNTVMECDFYQRLPSQHRLHTARMYLDETTVHAEAEMLDNHLPRAMTDIASTNPDVCVFGCTSAGALYGNTYEARLISRLGAEARCGVVSVAAAARNELRDKGVETVTVVTPYVDELNTRIRDSLEADGIAVAGVYGFGISDNFAIAGVAPAEIVQLATRSHMRHKADALFISCTNLRALEAAPWLESNLEVPVVTSNGAALRATVKALEGMEDKSMMVAPTQVSSRHTTTRR